MRWLDRRALLCHNASVRPGRQNRMFSSSSVPGHREPAPGRRQVRPGFAGAPGRMESCGTGWSGIGCMRIRRRGWARGCGVSGGTWHGRSTRRLGRRGWCLRGHHSQRAARRPGGTRDIETVAGWLA